MQTHTRILYIFMYTDDVFCHIEGALLFTAPWTGSPDGRVPITEAPTAMPPLCMCVSVCACMYSSMNVCKCKYREGERERDVHLRNCAHFLAICLQGGPCLCVDGVRASQRQHTARQKCDIPSKASSEPFPLQRRV